MWKITFVKKVNVGEKSHMTQTWERHTHQNPTRWIQGSVWAWEMVYCKQEGERVCLFWGARFTSTAAKISILTSRSSVSPTSGRKLVNQFYNLRFRLALSFQMNRKCNTSCPQSAPKKKNLENGKNRRSFMVEEVSSLYSLPALARVEWNLSQLSMPLGNVSNVTRHWNMKAKNFVIWLLKKIREIYKCL